MDGLQNYLLVDKDPRMVLAKKLGESGSCTAAVNILTYLLKTMGASDDFIGPMTNARVLVEKLKSDDIKDYQNEEECMEPAFVRVFFMIGDLLLKNEETEGELKKTWSHTTEETSVPVDAFNGLNVMLGMAHECIYHSQQILERLIYMSDYMTNINVEVQGQMLLDLAETHSRIGDIMRLRKDFENAIHSYHNSISTHQCERVTGEPKKLIARDHYHLSLCYEELYGEKEEGGNRAVKEGDKGEDGKEEKELSAPIMGIVVRDLSAADLLNHSIAHSFASLLSLALYLAESCKEGNNQNIEKAIQEIGEEVLKHDGENVASKHSINFNKAIQRILIEMKKLPCCDSDKNLGIIHEFVERKIVMRVRQMVAYLIENEIGNKEQQSVQIV